MSGTEWTEPGQGATRAQLHDAFADFEQHRTAFPENRSRAPFNSLDGRRTNLCLTGEPLTAEDVRRIAEAK